jgi:hypothetical protein
MPTEEHPPHKKEGPLEEHSFDVLARDLADGTLSRQRVLKLVGAAILGSALSIVALPDGADARARHHHHHGNAQKKKKRNRGPTGSTCLPAGTNCRSLCPGSTTGPCAACCTGLCSNLGLCCLSIGASTPGDCSQQTGALCCSGVCDKVNNVCLAAA